MANVHPTTPGRRRPIMHEAIRLGGLALLTWLVVGGVLAGVALAATGQRRLPHISQTTRLAAARLAQDTAIGSLAGYRAPQPEPAPALAPSPEPAAASSPFPTVAPASVAGAEVFLPILYYHHPPANFDAQLTFLEAHGYHIVSLDAALAGLAGGALPSRPVVLTFDDGFADQLAVLPILQRHAAPATFYIINGGDASNWCIGAGRRYNAPGQPAGGCGDAYLSWDQIRALDRSGLVTIGGHTLDHPNLAALSADEQYREIADSKAGIERQIGHSIRHFAYPYGSYSSVTISQVQRAGFQDAVSTASGTDQSLALRWTLARLSSAFLLPA